MFVSIGHKLRGLGKIRFGVGVRMKGATAWIMLLLYGMLNLMWYIMLGTLWLIYGIIYVCFYLPIKVIIKYSKNEETTR